MDSVETFRALAAVMAVRQAEFAALGFCDLDLEVVVESDPAFAVLLRFRDYGCEVVEVAADELPAADCRLEGGAEVWEEIRDDVVAHGGATGRRTLSSLVLVGGRLRLRSDDTMGADRFFRYAETMQRFFDGLAALRAEPDAGLPFEPEVSSKGLK